MTQDFDREDYKLVQELQKLEKGKIELALECLEDFGSSSSKEFDSSIKQKLSNAHSLLEDIKRDYKERLDMSYQEIKEMEQNELD